MMRSTISAACVRRSICGGLLTLWLAISALAPGADIVWESDWARAQSAMQSASKPGMIYFFNLRARPCREMSTKTFVDPEVIRRVNQFVAVGLMESENKTLIDKFGGLYKVPTVIFLDSQGREMDRAVGFKSADAFVQYLDRVLAAQGGSSTAPAVSAPAGTMALTPELASTAVDAAGKFEESAVDIISPRQGATRFDLKIVDPSATSMHLLGDFNDWRTDAHPMFKGPSGEWALTIYVPDGLYEYLFFKNGGEYVVDSANPYKQGNPYGGVNSVLIAGSPKKSPEISGQTVTFYYYNQEAQAVDLAGSFTNWNRVKMFRNPADVGMWGMRYTLPAGDYQYKIVVDEKWQMDKENYTPVSDGNGNMNSSFSIR